MRSWWAGVVIALHVAQPGRAYAEGPAHCAPIEGAAPSLAAIDAPSRLGFVRDVMADQARRARTWSWGWALGGLGLSAGNFGLAALGKTPDDRVDSLVGGVTSLFIPAAIVVKPLAVMAADAALEDYVARVSSTRGEADACVTLARAEELFVASADDEELGVGVLAQAIAIGGNAAIALFLGLGYQHWGGALLNGGGGLVITEIQIFTQPTGAARALARYRHGDIARDGSPAHITWRIAPLVDAASGPTGAPAIRGVAIGATF